MFPANTVFTGLPSMRFAQDLEDDDLKIILANYDNLPVHNHWAKDQDRDSIIKQYGTNEYIKFCGC